MSEKFALLGETLGHTMSPPIHQRLFELKGRSAEYGLMELTPEELKNSRGKLSELRGFNITIPHKQGIIPFCEELAESAKRYRSVNCVDVRDGRFVGHNTDCDGFLKTVRAMDVPLGKALLIGCGGVGRMMAIESALAGYELYIAVLESDLPLAEQVEREIKEMAPEAVLHIVTTDRIDGSLHYELLMNACPVGMYPKVEGCPVSDGIIAAAGAVFDVIYNPRETVLMRKARAMGKQAEGGMAMLVWQAVRAHEIWHGDSYTDEEVRAIIAEMEDAVERDFK